MFDHFFRKKNTYTMDMETANQTLQNIFATCEAPPNTVPFDKLVLRQQAHTKSLFCLKWICFGWLMLTLVSPLAFSSLSSPEFTIEASQYSEIQVVNHYIENGHFHVFLEGPSLDLGGSYITAVDGTIYKTDYYDNASGEVIFPYPGGEVNIFISKNNGDYLQMILTPRK